MRGKDSIPDRDGSSGREDRPPTRERRQRDRSPPIRRRMSLSPQRRVRSPARNRSPGPMMQSPGRRPVMRRDGSPGPGRQRARSPLRREIEERPISHRERSPPLRRRESPAPSIRRQRPTSPNFRNVARGRNPLMRSPPREELIISRTTTPPRRRRNESPVEDHRMAVTRDRGHIADEERFEERPRRQDRVRQRSPLLNEREMRELSPPRKRPIRRSPEGRVHERRRVPVERPVEDRRVQDGFRPAHARRAAEEQVIDNRRGEEERIDRSERRDNRRMSAPERSRFSLSQDSAEQPPEPRISSRQRVRTRPSRSPPPRSSRPAAFSPQGQRRPHSPARAGARSSPPVRRRPVALLETPGVAVRKPRSPGSRTRTSRSGRPREERSEHRVRKKSESRRQSDQNMDEEYVSCFVILIIITRFRLLSSYCFVTFTQMTYSNLLQEFVDEEVYEELDAMDNLDIEINDFS